MLAKAGSDSLPNAPLEHSRHLSAMTRFVERARQATDPKERSLTLILRSAASGPAKALLSLGSEIREAGVMPKIILAKLEPREELEQLAALMTEIYGGTSDSGAIRWTKNPKLLDAHEQAILGTTQCWSGDAMGRDPSRRNSLSLFAADAPDMVRLAELGFTALWHAAEPVSERRLIAAVARMREPDAFPQEDPIDFGRAEPAFANFTFFRH
ncbi:hypothetical protein A7A08_03152 [Methyloligella halotolerans]|uniref:Uncharacterized protein n=1 Tax=Methyloligella halotolerans TaxID=1177755 RepID=A0A1E2RV81_9HYPH|nr:hypothetical protein [Methyloligella halotolerans]ODA66008.1 hypothetical protein A7A08_03152 [Methyloligella halotolerans]